MGFLHGRWNKRVQRFRPPCFNASLVFCCKSTTSSKIYLPSGLYDKTSLFSFQPSCVVTPYTRRSVFHRRSDTKDLCDKLMNRLLAVRNIEMVVLAVHLRYVA